MRRTVAALIVLASLGPLPGAAQTGSGGAMPATTYLRMVDEADFRGVALPADEVLEHFGVITADPAVDALIRHAAEARGYRRQPMATTELAFVDGWRLQPAAAQAWLALKVAANADGIDLVVTSAFRDLQDQQALFLSRLAGADSSGAIGSALRFVAPPGYSRHHSGFAIDVGEAGGERDGFVNTRAHAWLAGFDFARAKAFGFVPSYPADGVRMGPEPEPWELVWVGTGRIACAAGVAHATGFCDVGGTEHADAVEWLAERGVVVGCRTDRFCPDDPVTRGEAASMLWRLHGAPDPDPVAPFSDVYSHDHFVRAVEWLRGIGAIEGTGPETFSPDALLTRTEALAVLVRLTEVRDRPAPAGIVRSGSAPPPVPTSRLEAGWADGESPVGRGEFASLLLRAASGA